jgi:hypothetical protein
MIFNLALLLISSGLAAGFFMLWRRHCDLRSDVDRLRQYNLRQARTLKNLEDQSDSDEAAANQNKKSVRHRDRLRIHRRNVDEL